MLKKSLDSSHDETQTFEKGKMGLAKLGETTICRITLRPGWSWEKSIKPHSKNRNLSITASIQYIISCRIGVSLEDGTKEELGPLGMIGQCFRLALIRYNFFKQILRQIFYESNTKFKIDFSGCTFKCWSNTR